MQVIMVGSSSICLCVCLCLCTYILPAPQSGIRKQDWETLSRRNLSTSVSRL